MSFSCSIVFCSTIVLIKASSAAELAIFEPVELISFEEASSAYPFSSSAVFINFLNAIIV
jgi:hypothetical protein